MSGTRSVGSAKPLTVSSVSIPKRSRTLKSTVGSAAHLHSAVSHRPLPGRAAAPPPRYVSQMPS